MKGPFNEERGLLFVEGNRCECELRFVQRILCPSAIFPDNTTKHRPRFAINNANAGVDRQVYRRGKVAVC